MTDDEHKRTLAAGVEFYSCIKDILKKYELDDTHATSLVLVAVGAVLRITNMTPDSLASAGQILSKYWYWDPKSELAGGAQFEDPSDKDCN